MAVNDSSKGALAPMLSALATMQSNVAGKEKVEAHEFLEKFQKSVCDSGATREGEHLTV